MPRRTYNAKFSFWEKLPNPLATELDEPRGCCAGLCPCCQFPGKVLGKGQGWGKSWELRACRPSSKRFQSSGLVAAFPWDPDLFLFILQEGLDEPSWLMQCSCCVASESSTSLSVSCAGAAQRPLGTQNSLQWSSQRNPWQNSLGAPQEQVLLQELLPLAELLSPVQISNTSVLPSLRAEMGIPKAGIPIAELTTNGFLPDSGCVLWEEIQLGFAVLPGSAVRGSQIRAWTWQSDISNINH